MYRMVLQRLATLRLWGFQWKHPNQIGVSSLWYTCLATRGTFVGHLGSCWCRRCSWGRVGTACRGSLVVGTQSCFGPKSQDFVGLRRRSKAPSRLLQSQKFFNDFSLAGKMICSPRLYTYEIWGQCCPATSGWVRKSIWPATAQSQGHRAVVIPWTRWPQRLS
jgi:hypothetical protein